MYNFNPNSKNATSSLHHPVFHNRNRELSVAVKLKKKADDEK